MLPHAAEPRVAQPGFLPCERVAWPGSRAGDRDPTTRWEEGQAVRGHILNRPQMRTPIVPISRMTQPRHREVKWVAQGHTAG